MADFTKIDGVYAKDTELRSGIDTLRTTVLSNTIKPLTVTKNGTYTSDPTVGTYGYSPITVDVQEEPWAPLQDGYSNFWFELTNDTLSPWLNFSAKNNDATIDWGDGSGEVSLDTLTPTHTYSKAGRYVVKVKGVTGIEAQHTEPYRGNYFKALEYVEHNSEINSVAQGAYRYCVNLKRCISSLLSDRMFYICPMLQSFDVLSGVTVIPSYALSYCYSIQKITIPATVLAFQNYAYSNDAALQEIHIAATSPPTLGTNVFSGLPYNYLIYVPVGTLSAYQTAWSKYINHIVEEGSQFTRSQLRAIELENSKKSSDIEEMR